MFNNFYYTDDIFSNGSYLIGSTQFSANLSIEEKRICGTCKHELSKFRCSSIGKIKNPDNPYCSWWKDKKLNLKIVRGYRKIK